MRRRRTAAVLAVMALVAGLAVLRARRPGPAPGPSGAAALAHQARPGWSRGGEDDRVPVEGSVRGEGGQPIAQAAVAIAVRRKLEPERDVPLAAYAFTGGDGRFRVLLPSPGVYAVTAAAQGFLPAMKEIALPAARRTPVELVLRGGGHTLSGRVLDTGGGPVAGARVRAWLDGGWSTSARQPMVLAVAAGDGTYQLALTRGVHALLVEADGYAPERASVTIAGAQRRDFRLNPASALSGTVVRRGTGAPVPQARLTAVSRDAVGETIADEAGRFALTDLEPGDYTITATAGSLAGRSLRVSVGFAGRVDGVVVEVDSGRSIAGHVRRKGGAAVAGAAVRVLDRMLGDRGPQDRQQTGGDGAFRFEGLLPGEYLVGVSTPGLTGPSRRVRIASEDVTDADLEVTDTATVAGRVLDQQGRPVADASVLASNDRGSESGPTRTDGEGRFELGTVEPGPIDVEAEHPARGLGKVKAGVVGAGERREVTIRLAGGVRVRGHVLWEDGGPAPGILLSANDGGGELAASAASDGEGAYVVGPFSVGEVVYLTIEEADRWHGRGGPGRWQMLRIERPGDITGVDFRVPRADSRVGGVVLGPDGRPLAGAVVQTFPGPVGQRAVTGDDGRFTIDELPRGSYEVFADHAGLPRARVPDVTSGRDDVVVKMAAGGVIAGTVRRADGRPAVPCTVWAQSGADGPPRGRQWVAAADGAFELVGLAPGTYDVLATTADGATGSLPGIAVGAAETRRGLELRVGSGAAVRGRVVDLESRRPLVGAAAHVTCDDHSADAITDADGAFRVDGFPRGMRLSVEVSRAGWMDNGASPLVPVSGGEVDAGTIPLLADRPETTANGRIGLVFGLGDSGEILVKDAPVTMPAGRAGLRAGDVILSIDGRSMEHAALSAVTTLVRGDPGTPVTLVVAAPGSPARQLRVTRM